MQVWLRVLKSVNENPSQQAEEGKLDDYIN